MNKKPPVPLLKQLNALYKIISHPYSFIFVLFLIIGWFTMGFLRDFDEGWYKAFHLFEISVALLMVFIIESTQQADNRAMQEKLDEIIKSLPKANDNKMELEKTYKGEK